MNARIASLVALVSLTTLFYVQAQDQPAGQRPTRTLRAPAAAQPGLKPMTTEPGPLVTLEVLMIDHRPAADSKKSPASPTAAELIGLNNEGKLDRVVRVQLSSVGGSTGTVQLGERVPVPTARSARPFGGRGATDGDSGFSYSYTLEDIGTLVLATTRVEEGGTVIVDLHVERSHLAKYDTSGDAPGDAAMVRQKTVRVSSQSTLRLKPGEPLLAKASQTTAGGESVGQYVVVTAHVE